MAKKYQVSNIQWVKDGQQVHLPSTYIIPLEDDLEGDELMDRLSDTLSDDFGYLHNGFVFQEIKD